MPLTNVAIKNAPIKPKRYKLFDSNGLFLLIHPSGGKYWQLKYRVDGKEKIFSLGIFGEVTLAEAREKASTARKLVKAGIDPSQQKKLQKLEAKINRENSFRAIAMEWHEHNLHRWTQKHAKNVLTRLERDILPHLGNRPITAILPAELLSILRKVEERGAIDLTHRLFQVVSQIFRFAVATTRAERDITADLRGALKTQKKQHLAYLKESELPDYLEKLGNYHGDDQTKNALRFLLHTFVRTGELRGARWAEIDFPKAEWRIPPERMKMRELHIVPLSQEVVAILEEQRRISGNYEHVFPNRNRPKEGISENTILFALYRLGYHGRATAHGFRATASTILNERGFRSEIIERQLAHGERNQVRASYNHAQYLQERREMMQWWSSFIQDIN